MAKANDKQEMLDQEKSLIFKIRHTAEHVLHQAVKELYPDIHLAMGPATDDGFYFDFDANPDGGEGIKISEEDFPKIEKRMHKIIAAKLPVTRHELSVEEARKVFADNPYKQEWIDKIESLGEKVTVYWTGEPEKPGSMLDLCAGPHIDNTGEIKAFKLLSVAGAYWHGDEKNKMLTRIYGTAFESQEELDAYLAQLEEAKKRDHKKLGKELGLFTFSNLVGAGLPLWTPKGTLLRNILDDYVWELRKAKGYQKVTIPHITKKDLYETSGHWAKFADDLFKIDTREGHEFAMKPMNCPHHTQIFNHVPRSYRDLPQRYAETTMVYRDEQTGELNGLSRVRCITQDDAHVFCRESQLQDEFYAIWDVIEKFYKACGFPELEVRLSLHDPENFKNYLGTKEDWAKSEEQLRKFAKERGVKFIEQKGEAAFYGPKIDFVAKDSLGREWQVATIQADRSMPESFDLNCVSESGDKERIVMIHAAIMGSIERFLSILIEHSAGKFPVWLSPVQVRVLPISEKHLEYAREVVKKLQVVETQHVASVQVRVELDSSAESLGKKIRNAQKEKLPYMLVVGDKEAENNQVAVRARDGEKQEVMQLEDFVEKIKRELI
ncbi:MAG: threonine--tRNA ligase [Patescibacteria group bacterium]